MKRVIPLCIVVNILIACAVGPSTRVEPVHYPIVVPSTATEPTVRSFLDSLASARSADRPDSAPPELWKPMTLSVHSARDLAWLDILRDSQLVALVRIAITNNRDLRTAQARIREFRAERGVARGDFFPQISANASGAKNKVVVPGRPTAFVYQAVIATADLAWELDFWGRVRRQAEAANFDYRAREDDARATTLTLISNVATAYIELRELDEDLRISEQTLTTRRVTLDIARRRLAQGIISELDVRQFEAQIADPAARVADFARQRREKENELSLLIGSPPSDIPRGRPLGATVQSVVVPDSLPGSLVTRRPDVLSAQRAWQAATARVGVAVANRFPLVTLRGQYGSQRPHFEGLFSATGSEIYTLQAGVSLPLFTGGKLLNSERAARARADQAKAQYEQTALIALREANDALVGVRSNRDQLVAQQTQAEALRLAYSLAQRRYTSGISSYLEVLDAQRSVFAAELTLIQVQRQYLASVVQLYRALGGSWQ